MRKPLGKIKSPKVAKRIRRKLSIRRTLSGTADVPRITLDKTNKHLRVQVVDDVTHKTLFSVQTYGKEAAAKSNNKEGAKAVGTKLAEKLKAAKIETAVFDRSGYKYTGVIAVLCEAVREQGIKL
ncbi:MAG: 50S ribosomal protein L18 [Halobacteriovoraceae bacterium]|jgi:large subunit ribosomal protein L18|nr:50S ribosomal protein L18 [Halobacteriovoraceae bacterium]MBT5094696.1 50S ribosomal protein L18 [Halobacteriovoraceae bacterium]